MYKQSYKDKAFVGLISSDRKNKVYAKYKLLSWNDKIRLAKECIKYGDISEADLHALTLRFINPPPKTCIRGESSDDYFQARYGMFTYNAKKYEGYKRAWSPDLSGDAVTELCRSDPEIIEQWKKIDEDFQVLVENFECFRWSVSFEVCTKTWLMESKLKLHVHIVMEFSSRRRIRRAVALTLNGVKPSHAQVPSDNCAKKAAKNTAPMHYYLQMPKYGKVFSASNYHAYTDFAVNARWITNFIQSHKMSYTDASNVPVLLVFVRFDS